MIFRMKKQDIMETYQVNKLGFSFLFLLFPQPMTPATVKQDPFPTSNSLMSPRALSAKKPWKTWRAEEQRPGPGPPETRVQMAEEPVGLGSAKVSLSWLAFTLEKTDIPGESSPSKVISPVLVSM